ncbi:HAD hydrolase-like protein [Pseudomonas denitrificans (nom. rej.)]|nr:HAD hydrolase-like protein [Pseudomonas denitrificans (nom. rej.)]
MKLSDYKTLIFDCDGVILDSNKVKTQAFFTTALPYGEAAAIALVDYHTANGGISRYRKFEYFLSHIVGRDIDEVALQQLLVAYSSEVHKGLRECQCADGLAELRGFTEGSRWLVASGGDQQELRELFRERGLADLFDGGIFGSPDNKIDILQREVDSANIQLPALFIGDSRYDHVAASHFDMGFVFVQGWTEFEGYIEYCEQHGLKIVDSLKSLLPTLPERIEST